MWKPQWRVVIALCGLSGIARADDPVVTFTDVTTTAGVSASHWDGIPLAGPNASLAYMVGGAAAADFDNDGWVDLYVTRVRQPNLLYRNLGDGTFADVAATAGVDFSGRSSGCIWGDVNNDGWVDLYLLTINRNGQNFLYLNNGDGTFREEAAAWGVAMTGGVERGPSSAAFGDYDLDGRLDLVVWTWSADNPANALYHNEGGAFVDVTEAARVFERIPRQGVSFRDEVEGWSGAFSDMDGDGWADLVHAGDFVTSRYYRNRRNGSFEDVTEAARVGTDENGMGSAIGDYDNDGDLDWFVTAIFDPNAPFGDWDGSGNRFYQNEGDSLFSDQTDARGVRDGGWGWGASFLDYDNDGDLDLVMTNGVDFPFLTNEDRFNHDPMKLWRNDGPGLMPEVSTSVGLTDTRSGKGLVVFDYDRDGDLDLFIANNADTPMLYRNDGGSQRAWLQVTLRGTLTSREGIGAVVRVQATPESPVQMRELRAASNFMSQNETLAHFGFDRPVSVLHRVWVTWPASGTVSELHDVPVNQRLLLAETCAGDTDGSATIDLADLETVLTNFGRTATQAGDVTGDQAVTLSDLAVVLRNFGRNCH